MKIKELPFNVILELCSYLDNPTLPHQSWRGLLAKAPGNIYKTQDVGAFERVGNRPNSSPTEAVIQDFITRGFTVDQLYTMLTEIGHIEGRRVLKDYVSPHLLENLEQPPPVNDSEPPPPSHDLHPLYGYLPNDPPPITSRGPYTSRKQEDTTASSKSTRPASLPANSGSVRRIAEDGTSVQNGPKFEQDIGRGRMESGMGGRESMNGNRSPQFPKGMRNSPVDVDRAPNSIPPHQYGAFSPPLTSTSSTSLGQYTSSSGSSFSEEGMPRPLSQATPVYTPSDQSDHSILPGQLHSSSWDGYPSMSTTPTSSVDVFIPNILSFSYAELSEVTGDFTQNIVGLGTFGTVFSAKIRGNGPYAIKKLHSESEMEGGMFYDTFHRETFTQELQLLTKYNHRNILSLVAYSNDGPRPCLVYEYMENGSLAECLMGKRPISLLWSVRLKIANQIADALHFLHTVNQPKCLVHGDVKSANILLDSHLIPKLSDFGLARECHRKPSQQSTYSTQSKVVMGTMAYMAPEFLRNRKLTPKTDVYSFGVVLLELYTGLAADDPSLEERRILTQRLVHLFEDTNEREVSSIADARAAWPQNVGFDLFTIATVCLRKKAKDRPQMDQVRAQLSHSSPELDMSQLQFSDPPAYSLPGHAGTVATP